MVSLNGDSVSIVIGDTTLNNVNGFHQLQNHYFNHTGGELPYNFKNP